jgi:DNA-binding MarR family transcriptional regulator
MSIVETQDLLTGREAAAADGRLQTRLWLRLLTCTQLIETEIRGRLRSGFETTLPRFDVLAQLHSAGTALTMGELSARLMVTTGNVTGLIDAMEQDDLVARQPNPADRRSTLIAATGAGQTLFAAMAPAHQRWIDGLTAGLSRAEMALLFELLGKLKESVSREI